MREVCRKQKTCAERSFSSRLLQKKIFFLFLGAVNIHMEEQVMSVSDFNIGDVCQFHMKEQVFASLGLRA